MPARALRTVGHDAEHVAAQDGIAALHLNDPLRDAMHPPSVRLTGRCVYCGNRALYGACKWHRDLWTEERRWLT